MKRIFTLVATCWDFDASRAWSAESAQSLTA